MRISITKPFFDLLTKQEKRAQKASDAAAIAVELERAAKSTLADTLAALAIDAGGGGENYTEFSFGAAPDGGYFLQLTPEPKPAGSTWMRDPDPLEHP